MLSQLSYTPMPQALAYYTAFFPFCQGGIRKKLFVLSASPLPLANRAQIRYNRQNGFGDEGQMLGDRIYMLRRQRGYSQEKFAEKLGLSRQAIQRWESGTASPDLDNLVRIAKCFNVSMDWLNDLSSQQSTEALRRQSDFIPCYEDLESWECYGPDLAIDYQQALDEGRDVRHAGDIVQAVCNYPNGLEKERLADVLFGIFCHAPMRPDYPWTEPDDLPEIRQLRPEPPALPDFTMPDASVLRDRLTGAWRGRVCGCALGKPVECILPKELHTLLRLTGNEPFHRYITSRDIENPAFDRFEFPLRSHQWPDQMSGAFPGDDDTNYTVFAARIVDQYGLGFTSSDVCRWWKNNQNLNAFATAERIAYRNMLAGYGPPETALLKNPFREWIGAQIRGDYFGYINPGDPETAAELAWRDARISHVKNGIYGEMFAAAMLAGAAVLDDPLDVVVCGLSQIPVTSRLYAAVRRVCDGFQAGRSLEAFTADFYRRYDASNRSYLIHVLPNAEIVAAALLYGGKDYTKSICSAVHFGLDTDCNGATVGSVVGMMTGSQGIAPAWTDPIQDTVFVSGLREPVTTDSLVDCAMRHIAMKQERAAAQTGDAL